MFLGKIENIVGKEESAGHDQCFEKAGLLKTRIFFFFDRGLTHILLNPLPHIPILGSSNSAANKDMMSKILTYGDKII